LLAAVSNTNAATAHRMIQSIGHVSIAATIGWMPVSWWCWWSSSSSVGLPRRRRHAMFIMTTGMPNVMTLAIRAITVTASVAFARVTAEGNVADNAVQLEAGEQYLLKPIVKGGCTFCDTIQLVPCNALLPSTITTNVRMTVVTTAIVIWTSAVTGAMLKCMK